MSKPTKAEKDAAEVATKLATLTAAQREVVEALRALIRATDPTLIEHIKWNAPSYQSGGDDRITFNLARADTTRLIFHRGASAKDTKTGQRIIQDNSGHLTWATDQRADARFPDLTDVAAKADWLAAFIPRWIAATT